ncbi:hypothetical protein SAMN04487948_1273 [Halogranum amylolyticum]|uniref:Type I restriction enzyme R protein N terminus (HSDR_N) n=1 Tax=Halogranum amylolyticum TaxID=660520 RepID=A0A1H8WC32_9EURY|nr:hypothetical protein [Halogranum amylolyticum]SEP25169.1 hypothetical protein SAMN04487948_1273 [Halogranum amylolyticum]
MNEKRGLSSLEPDSVIAERVRQQLSPFPEKFRDLGEPGELRRMLTGTKTLSGPRVRQQPEDFTEQYLIEPVLHGLGYWNPMSKEYESGNPHFVRQPSEYRNVEPKRPDYKLEHVGDSVVCLVEAKAANNEQVDGAKQHATADVKQYLQSDTFCRVLRDQEHEYLVGIGTDGLRWTLWSKHLATGEIIGERPKIDLAAVLKANAQRQGTIEGNPRMSRPEQRRKLSDTLVPAFAARNLEQHVR